MASANNLAKQVGLNPVTCGGCGKNIKTKEPLDEFFKSLVEHVRDGERVSIPGLGTFSSREMKGRSVESPVLPGGKVEYPDQTIMRFRPSETVRGILNPEIHGEEAKKAKQAKPEKKAASKKKPASKKKATKKKSASKKKATSKKS